MWKEKQFLSVGIRRRGYTRVLFNDTLVCCPTVSSFLHCSVVVVDMGERKMSSGNRLVKEGEGEDIWAKATKTADDLYILRDTYFPPNPLDKISKLQSQSDFSLNLLDSIPLGGFSFSLASILIIKKIYLFNRMLGTQILCLLIGNLKMVVIISMTLLFLSIKSLSFDLGTEVAPPLSWNSACWKMLFFLNFEKSVCNQGKHFC